jgi:DNA mismatch repair protein MutS2
MDEHALGLLEFARVVAEVRDYCFSAEGSAAVAAQAPTADVAVTAERLGLAVALRAVIEQAPLPALDFPETAASVERLAKTGVMLAPEELAAVARAIVSATTLRRHVSRGAALAASSGRRAGPSSEAGLASPDAVDPAAFGRLGDIADEIPDLDELARMVFRVVDRDGQVREKEIPELRSISSRIQTLRGDVARMASAWLADPDRRAWWQSDRPTVKDGRTVLALRANYRGRLAGIVHESSATGATVYVEPADIVEKNNEITLQRGEYDRELARILRETSGKLAAHEPELRRLLRQVAELDTLHARVRYSSVHQCAAALPSAGEVSLVAARHPLLRKAVPIEVQMSESVRTLIITGPNTGGKTVSLKTVGLLALMNQFGMEIPAAPGSRLPVFDGIFADIGDEQSIEQSLSTFSGHVRNLARIVQVAGPRSLVLLDELGAGTDPEEGVAIAMAVLDTFIERRSLTLVTTHHGILKNYGYTRPGVMNASMEFDTGTLSPTFRIRLGVPGESHALDIARGHGMPEALLEQARAYLSDERSDISKVIERLAARERELADAAVDARRRESELRELRRATDLRELRVRQKERELRQAGIADLRRFLDDGRRRLDGLIQQIRASEGTLNRDLTRQAAEFVRELRDRVDAEERRVEAEEREEIPAESDEVELEPGMDVIVRTTGRRGKLLRRSRGLWVVETDTVRASLPASQLRRVEPNEAPPRVEVVASVDESPRAAMELDLRGYRLDEALSAMRRQLDAAALQGMREFGVIHGKGEGVLREAVHRFLKAEGVVEEFGFSRPEAGGFGRTFVRLKAR